MFRRALTFSFLLVIPLAGSARNPEPSRAPTTAQKPVTDEIHGLAITDNYRWLEDQQSPETQAWIAEQKQYTDNFLQAIPGREQSRQRLTALLRIDQYRLPVVRKQRQFFIRRLGDKNYSQICLCWFSLKWREGALS